MSCPHGRTGWRRGEAAPQPVQRLPGVEAARSKLRLTFQNSEKKEHQSNEASAGIAMTAARAGRPRETSSKRGGSACVHVCIHHKRATGILCFFTRMHTPKLLI